MGRHASGWKLRPPSGKNKTYYVYWWSVEDQRQREYSTGETDPQRAAVAAAKVYGDHTAGKLKSRGVKPGPSLVLTDVAVDWIEAMGGADGDGTLAIYSIYFETHLGPHFGTLDKVGDVGLVRDYVSNRLKKVQGKTVRKELSALRGLCSWAADKGLISEVPMIPGVPKKVLGTTFSEKRRAPAIRLSKEEVQAVLDALPVRVSKLGFVRPRFVFQYEMGLRPSTVDRIESPLHWSPGGLYLDVNAASIKGKVASKKRLTAKAIEAIEQCYSKPGLVWGRHDYRNVIREAAKVLEESKQELFIACHLRSAAITHYCAAGATLLAAQNYADHKLATTTDRYLRATELDNEEELRRQGRL